MFSTLTVLIDSALLFVYFITEHVLFFGSAIFALIIAWKLNAHFGKRIDIEDASNIESDRRDVSPVPEKKEESSDLDRSSNRTSFGLARIRRLEKDRRTVDWVRDARKICRQLMVVSSSSSSLSSTTTLYGGYRLCGFKEVRSEVLREFSQFQNPNYLPTSPDNNGEHHLFSQKAAIRRRHSNVGPFQLARAAKDFIVHGSNAKFQRQLSEMTKRTLPKPPSQFFEPSEIPDVPQNERPEVYYVLHNIKMLELPSEWYAQWKDLAVEEYEENDYLIRPGDKDKYIIVVLEGIIAVFITHTEGKELMVRKISMGDSFFSLLSILDVLMNHEITFRNISVRALTSCRIARYSTSSFRDSFIKNPKLWVRPIQIVLTRLLHVTLTTLHQYLGLSYELAKKRSNEKRSIDERYCRPSFIRLQSKMRSRTHRPHSTDDKLSLSAFRISL